MKQLVIFILVLCSTTIFSQENITVRQPDSVNIRAILQRQIDKIRSKEEQKPNKSVNNIKSANIVRESASGSENIFIRIFILTDLGLGIILFVLWRRRNIKARNTERTWLKKNILKLREDKITSRENKELRKLRKKLVLEPVCNSSSTEYVSQFAKKQSISKGELLLAARLNSYKQVKDVSTGF